VESPYIYTQTRTDAQNTVLGRYPSTDYDVVV
jgi:hypothetical protein